MAQEILVKEILEKEMVKAGKELLQRLAKTDLKITAALWLWASERNRWRLVIASPWVNKNGPLETYDKIRAVLYEKTDPVRGLPLMDIQVMETTAPLIKALRVYAKKYQTDLAGERLKDYWLGDVSVDDSYVYFVK